MYRIRMFGFYVQPILLEDFGHSFWVGLDDLIVKFDHVRNLGLPAAANLQIIQSKNSVPAISGLQSRWSTSASPMKVIPKGITANRFPPLLWIKKVADGRTFEPDGSLVKDACQTLLVK